MTTSQTKLYWRLWGAACRAQQWHKEPASVRDALRKQAHQIAGVPQSSKDINATDHFDAIKAHFQMLAGNLRATIETDHPETGSARRLRDQIRNVQAPILCSFLCSADFQSAVSQTSSLPDHNPLTCVRAWGYINAIAKARFKAEDIGDVSDQPNFRAGQERPSNLQQLVFTVAARIQKLRKQADLTVHDMHARAGVRCPTACKQCEGARASSPAAMHEEPMPF